MWTFGGRSCKADHHELSDSAASTLLLPPRVPVLIHEARPDVLGGSRTLTDELLRYGFKEWAGIRSVQQYDPTGAGHDGGGARSLRQVVAVHVDVAGTGGGLPIVLTRERRHLAAAVEQLSIPGTMAAVLSCAAHRQDLVGVQDLGLNILAQIEGLGVHVLRDCRSPFALEHPASNKTRGSPARADRLVADLHAACFRHFPRQVILLVDLDALSLFRSADGQASDATLVAAALRLVQGLLMQPVVILHSTRAPRVDSDGELGGLAKHLGSCLFRDIPRWAAPPAARP